MLEFSSISVSSYDAASLADQLTAKSADGWDVVAIVPAGTNVTAYLSREAGAATEDAIASDASDDIAFSFGGDSAAQEAPSASTPEATAAAAALGASEEPAGWGTAPAQAAESSEAPVTDAAPAGGGESATAGVTSPSSTVDVAPATDSASSEPWSSSTASESAPVAQEQPAQQESAAAAPAGWYADPAGRYELRYWDGGQWTEHVSRAGQQYTDPPVA